jgi:hypothetical protein
MGWWSAVAGGRERRVHVCRRSRRTRSKAANEFRGPGLVGGQAEVDAPCGVGDEPGGVQEAVAQPFGFGPGEVAVEDQ